VPETQMLINFSHIYIFWIFECIHKLGNPPTATFVRSWHASFVDELPFFVASKSRRTSISSVPDASVITLRGLYSGRNTGGDGTCGWIIICTQLSRHTHWQATKESLDAFFKSRRVLKLGSCT